jgi:hypothetical protein
MMNHKIPPLYLLLLLGSVLILSACEQETVGGLGSIYPKEGDVVDPRHPVFRWDTDDSDPVTFRLGTDAMRETLVDTENATGEYRLDRYLVPGSNYTLELEQGDRKVVHDFQVNSIPVLFLGRQAVSLTYTLPDSNQAQTVQTEMHFVQSLGHLVLEFDSQPSLPRPIPYFRVPLGAGIQNELAVTIDQGDDFLYLAFDLERMAFYGGFYSNGELEERWNFWSL